MFKTEPLRKFFTYMTERQNIWHRRFVLKEPPPWTDDLLLRDLRFCNVYRELDKGTLYVTEHIADPNKKPEDILFRIILYRLFNEISTFKAMRPLIKNFDALKVSNMLIDRQAQGYNIFRNSWLTAGTGLHGPGSKIRDYCFTAESVYSNRREFYKLISRTKTMQEGWEAIKTVKWMGGFMGYQVALDYSYLKFIDWDEKDEWVYVGPGAKKGLYWLTGKTLLTDRDLKDLELDATEPLDYAKGIRHLQEHQRSYFKKFGLEFKRWEGKDLDVHNVQFSLCEFNKVSRATSGGRKKQYVYREEWKERKRKWGKADDVPFVR